MAFNASLVVVAVVMATRGENKANSVSIGKVVMEK